MKTKQPAYTRRNFLNSSALVVSGLQTGLIGSILRAQNAPGITSVRSPNSKLQLAIVGMGGISGGHASSSATKEALVAICDAYQGKIDNALKKLSDKTELLVPASEIKSFLNYREMLDAMGDKIDGVHVTTPDYGHGIVAFDAIKRGKHVLVEKPLTHNISEAYTLLEASRKYGVHTQMGNQGHMSPSTHKAVDHLRAKSIGEVTEVYHWNARAWGGGDEKTIVTLRPELAPDYQLWSVPTDIETARRNYDNSGYAGPVIGKVASPWFGDRRWGTGNLGDWGCHTMDAAHWGLKFSEASHYEVSCLDQRYGNAFYYHKTNNIRWRIPARGDMAACEVFWYDGILPNEDPSIVDEDGKMRTTVQNLPPKVVEVYQKYGKQIPEFGSMFVGEKGIMLAGGYSNFSGFLPEDLRKTIPEPPSSVPKPTGDKFTAWYHAIRTGEPSLANFEASVPLTEFVLTGVLGESVGKGNSFTYDLKTRSTNNPRINQLLTRTYRPGYEVSL